jgi:hypothetical protein
MVPALIFSAILGILLGVLSRKPCSLPTMPLVFCRSLDFIIAFQTGWKCS